MPGPTAATLANDPAAAPQAPALGRRLASLVYDALAAVALVLLVVAAFSVVTALFPGLPLRRPLLLASCFAVVGAYFTYCWHKGQTLAMRAWKIRIQGRDGQPPTWLRACARYLLAWVWVAPPLAWVAATGTQGRSPGQVLSVAGMAVCGWAVLWLLASLAHPRRQLWHDVAAGTRLVAA